MQHKRTRTHTKQPSAAGEEGKRGNGEGAWQMRRKKRDRESGRERRRAFAGGGCEEERMNWKAQARTKKKQSSHNRFRCYSCQICSTSFFVLPSLSVWLVGSLIDWLLALSLSLSALPAVCVSLMCCAFRFSLLYLVPGERIRTCHCNPPTDFCFLDCFPARPYCPSSPFPPKK